jgi:hypothetical protein
VFYNTSPLSITFAHEDLLYQDSAINNYYGVRMDNDRLHLMNNQDFTLASKRWISFEYKFVDGVNRRWVMKSYENSSGSTVFL